jgi:hypothetical protein
MSSSLSLGLNKGIYTVSFEFLTDIEAVRNFFIRTGIYEQIDSESWQDHQEVFANAISNYSVIYTLRIR